jgi:hypothetical protein
MDLLAVVVFVGTGGVLALAALISAYNASQSAASSTGLGIAAAGFSPAAALCYRAAAGLLRPPPAPTPWANLEPKRPA